MRLFSCVQITLALVLCSLSITHPFVSADELSWGELPEMPGKLGFGGPIAGTHNGALIVAGGANFPDGYPWAEDEKPAGPKHWYADIHILTKGTDANPSNWTVAAQLPYPLAYAPAISTDDGIYILGGETFGKPPGDENAEPANFATDQVLLLQWSSETKQLTVKENALPNLPKPCRYHNAGLIDNVIYVVASHAISDQSKRLDSKSFWSLDLSDKPEKRTWKELEPWPGLEREKMAVAVQNSGADDQYDSPKCLYMFSGANWYKDDAGQHDLKKFEHYTDNYRYSPKQKTWTKIADLPYVPETRDIKLDGYTFDAIAKAWRHLLPGEKPEAASVNVQAIFGEVPRPAGAGTAIDLGQSHVLLMSGSTGRYITMDTKDCPIFPADVLAYHTITDTWIQVGKMPQAVVTTAAVHWDGKIVITSGEIRPGVRTPKVQTVKAADSDASFGWINMSVIVIYLAALVGLGIYFSSRENGTEDFFLAGKRIPWWAAGLSIYATQLSAITFIALPAIPYVTNWLLYPAQLTMFLMAPVVVYWYLPFFRRLNVTSAYEYLERRFNLAARLFGSSTFIVFQLGRMAIVVFLPALALSAVTGMNVYASIIIMGVLATLYTVLGGMEAVIWTDVLQVFVLWGGMLLALCIIVADVGGIGVVFETARADSKLTMFNWDWGTLQMATWLIVLGNFALQFGPYTTDQAVIQRYMTTKSDQDAARSIWLNGMLTIPFGLLFFVLGTSLYVFFKMHPDLLVLGMKNDNVFPLFVSEKLPPGLSGLVIAGVFAASMSSLDSSIHSVATAITTDFYKRFKPDATDQQTLKIARVLTIVLGTIGTLLAIVLASWDIKSLLFLFQKLLGLTGSGLVGMFILGIFTRRANATGALTGAASSFMILLYIYLYTDVNFYMYAIVGIISTVVIGYLVSLLTPESKKDITGLSWQSLE
ncbi:MAG: ABC transporter substrate-binding protein [Blastopirellula sp.]|nr:MAG: ABC transporter substrate-binding protein [Blastopirellula sp.]